MFEKIETAKSTPKLLFKVANRTKATKNDMQLVAAIIEDQADMSNENLYDLIASTLYARGMYSGAAVQIAGDEVCKARNVQ